MKHLNKRFTISAFFATAVLCSITIIVQAQSKSDININGEPIGSWMSNNWMWVAGGVVLLILLIGILSGGSKRTRKTTIVREEGGNGVVRTTTTEIKD